jgi:hypothetical protein
MRNLAWSKYLTPSESVRLLPTLADPNPNARSLKGAVRRTRLGGVGSRCRALPPPPLPPVLLLLLLLVLLPPLGLVPVV